MFENCNTLAEMNGARKEYLSKGFSIMEVNSAYNRAKADLMKKVPPYRTIPTYTEKCLTPQTVSPLLILSFDGISNEIQITPQGVIM